MLKLLQLIAICLMIGTVLSQRDGGKGGDGKRGKRKRNHFHKTMNAVEFGNMCLHPGIEQGMTSGDGLHHRANIYGLSKDQVTVRLAYTYHVTEVEVCANDM